MDVKPELLEMTADIVSAYVSNNMVPAEAVPALISQVHAALTGITVAPVEEEPAEDIFAEIVEEANAN